LKKFRLDSDYAKANAIKAINELPADGKMVVELKKYTKQRSTGQNSLVWVALLADFAMQVEIDGRKFSPEAWHEVLKRNFLPDEFDVELTLPGYTKWEFLPDGSMKLVGSTTKLTTKGMNEYIEQSYAFGCSEFDIRFSANQKR